MPTDYLTLLLGLTSSKQVSGLPVLGFYPIMLCAPNPPPPPTLSSVRPTFQPAPVQVQPPAPTSGPSLWFGTFSLLPAFSPTLLIHCELKAELLLALFYKGGDRQGCAQGHSVVGGRVLEVCAASLLCKVRSPQNTVSKLDFVAALQKNFSFIQYSLQSSFLLVT